MNTFRATVMVAALASVSVFGVARPSEAVVNYSNVTTRMDDAPATNQALTYTNAVTAGSDLIVLVGVYNLDGGAGVTWSCTNSTGGSMVQRSQAPDPSVSQFNVAIFTQHNVNGGTTTITCSQSSLTAYFSMVMVEATDGFDATAPYDSESHTASSGTTVATGGIVSSAPARVFGIVYYESAGNITEDGGYTLIFESEATQLSVVTKSVGATTTDITWTLSNGGAWKAAGIAYLEGSAGGGGTSPRLMLLGVGE